MDPVTSFTISPFNREKESADSIFTDLMNASWKKFNFLKSSNIPFEVFSFFINILSFLPTGICIPEQVPDGIQSSAHVHFCSSHADDPCESRREEAPDMGNKASQPEELPDAGQEAEGLELESESEQLAWSLK